MQIKACNVVTQFNLTVRGVETCASGRKIEFVVERILLGTVNTASASSSLSLSLLLPPSLWDNAYFRNQIQREECATSESSAIQPRDAAAHTHAHTHTHTHTPLKCPKE